MGLWTHPPRACVNIKISWKPICRFNILRISLGKEKSVKAQYEILSQWLSWLKSPAFIVRLTLSGSEILGHI